MALQDRIPSFPLENIGITDTDFWQFLHSPGGDGTFAPQVMRCLVVPRVI